MMRSPPFIAIYVGMDLAVTSGVLATLREEAARAHPHECCGLLLGNTWIDVARPAANMHPDPARHFEIDPAVLIAAHRAARSGGPKVLGYYHSHPQGRAEPSVTDAAMAARDGLVWAIVAAGEVRLWRDGATGFEALPLRVVDG